MAWKRNAATVALIAVFSFAGGFAAQLVAGSRAQAAGSYNNYSQVSDSSNTRGIVSYIQDGQPGLVLYGEDGKMRVQIGTYGAAGERGLPLVGMSDNKGNLRLLLRMAGASESPVIVMKDNTGRDRLVMGLSFDEKQEPFLNVTTADGVSKDIFGSYGGHP